MPLRHLADWCRRLFIPSEPPAVKPVEDATARPGQLRQVRLPKADNGKA